MMSIIEEKKKSKTWNKKGKNPMHTDKEKHPSSAGYRWSHPEHPNLYKLCVAYAYTTKSMWVPLSEVRCWC